MRLSFWHSELAKRIAQGQTNREIMKEIKVSGSRLSVLKANPLFQREVDKFRQIEEDKYNKAIDVFADEAEVVAKEIVNIAKKNVYDKTKLDAGLAVLEKLGQAKGKSGGDQEELVFEQMLRVTKRGLGLGRQEDENEPIDVSASIRELEEDFQHEDFQDAKSATGR